MREFSLFQKSTVLCTALLVVLMVLAAPAHAQLAGSATITGTLTDPSGAFVPGRRSPSVTATRPSSAESKATNPEFIPLRSSRRDITKCAPARADSRRLCARS